MTGDPVVVVPGDLDVEDRIAGPVTFRMAAWLAAAAGGVALVATAHGDVASTALGILLVGAGLAGAWLRPGGRPVTAWVMPLLAYRSRRRSFHTPATEVSVPEPVVTVEEPAAADAVALPGQRRPPVRLVVVVAGVAVVAAGVAVSMRDGGAVPAAPVVGVEVPDPAPAPVVVVVPVDPFGGWEVGGDVVDPLCGC